MQPKPPNLTTWKGPGSPGRRPAWAKGKSDAEIRKILAQQNGPVAIVGPKAPPVASASPPPAIVEAPIDPAPMPNPLAASPEPSTASPGAPGEAADQGGGATAPDSVEIISAPSVPVSGSEPWNNPQIVSGLSPMIGGMGKWLLAFAAVKAGKQPPRSKDLDAWGFDEKATKSALVVYPALAEQDPRYLIVGEFVAGCIAIVKSQPDLNRAPPTNNISNPGDLGATGTTPQPTQAEEPPAPVTDGPTAEMRLANVAAQW